MDDSINGPRDFKQVRNVKYQKTKKEKKSNNGNSSNLSDEVLDCISLVDTHDFVQHWSKAKGRMPIFVCYTKDQRKDLIFSLSRKNKYPIGVYAKLFPVSEKTNPYQARIQRGDLGIYPLSIFWIFEICSVLYT